MTYPWERPGDQQKYTMSTSANANNLPSSGSHKTNNLTVTRASAAIKHVCDLLGNLDSAQTTIVIAIHCGYEPTARQCGGQKNQREYSGIAWDLEKALARRMTLLEIRKDQKKLTDSDKRRLRVTMRRLRTLENRITDLLKDQELGTGINGFTPQVREKHAQMHDEHAKSIPNYSTGKRPKAKSGITDDSGKLLARACHCTSLPSDPNHPLHPKFKSLNDEVKGLHEQASEGPDMGAGI